MFYGRVERPFWLLHKAFSAASVHRSVWSFLFILHSALDGDMHTRSLFLLFIICIQSLSPLSVFAQVEEETGSGFTIMTEQSASGSVIEGSGSVLTVDEIIEYENDSETGSSILDSTDPSLVAPLVSPLLIRISEVAWAGSDLSTADEWIELSAVPALTGAVIAQSLNIKGWSLTIQKDAGETVIATIAQDLFIGSGDYLVIANSPASASRLKADPAVVSSAISVPNTKLLLRLRNGDGEAMDTVDDFVGVPFAGSNPSAASGLPKASMERLDLRTAGTDKANWSTATTSRGFDHGANVLGTPGFPNKTIEPPDTTPPVDVLHPQAYRFSGSVLVGWTLPPGFDAAIIRVTVGASTYDLSATATGMTLALTDAETLHIQTIDHAENTSRGIELAILTVTQPIITELLPDPQGTGEEWIELGNLQDQSLDLSGWTLQSGSRKFVLPETLLGSGAHIHLSSDQTGLSLPNAGGEVRLFYRGVLIDHILYTEMPDGVSVGRSADREVRSFCVPTPAAPNAVIAPTITVTGFERETPNPTSLNLEVKALSGSIAGGSCTIDFGDGFVSNSCNPPSHAMKRTGAILLTTKVNDFCGNTVIQHDSISVVAGAKAKSTSSMSTVQRCIPSATGGIIISEFLAAPVSGQDEWIELRNVTDETVNLCGWAVDDMAGGSRAYRLDDFHLDAKQYLLIRSGDSGIALNNDADTVRLIAPDGKGGTGVLLAIPFQAAVTDRSLAFREDGILLETQFPTPQSDNRFAPMDTTPGSSPVILSAAMPNPAGADTWDEWLELTNLTGRPQWLNDWRLEDDTGKRLFLDGRVLAKREILRIPLYKTSFTLGNTDRHLRLIDHLGVIRSVLAWGKTRDGQMVRRPQECEEETIDHITLTDEGFIRGRTISGSTVTLTMSGVLQTDQILTLSDDQNYIYRNYISALTKNKNIVLKKCSKEYASISVDEADIALLLLQSGLAIADPTDTSARRDEFLVYEREARKQRRGVWNNLDYGLIVDAWKADRVLDHTVIVNGLQLKVTPDEGLLGTGSVISVETNVPADLWVRYGTGAYRPFDGGVFIHEDTALTFYAAYTSKTTSGTQIHNSVVTQSYSVQKSSYPDCLRISEVSPSPKKGESEWVELENVCEQDISLLGWSLDDVKGAGSKPFTFGGGAVVNAHTHFLLSGSLLKVSLNNGGDSVVLSDPNGKMHSAMTYGKTSAGRGWALVGDVYCQTAILTPYTSNICALPAAKGKKAVASAKGKKTVIGLSTKYMANLLKSDELSTKNDQFLGFMSGLNRNIEYTEYEVDFRAILAAFLFLLGVSSFGTGILLYMKKYRLWQ
jgi:hypothetical protein